MDAYPEEIYLKDMIANGYKPQWNGNLFGEYVRGWNIQSLIFMERNGDYYVWLQRI